MIRDQPSIGIPRSPDIVLFFNSYYCRLKSKRTSHKDGCNGRLLPCGQNSTDWWSSYHHMTDLGLGLCKRFLLLRRHSKRPDKLEILVPVARCPNVSVASRQFSGVGFRLTTPSGSGVPAYLMIMPNAQDICR